MRFLFVKVRVISLFCPMATSFFNSKFTVCSAALVGLCLLWSVNLHAAKGDVKAKKGVVLKFNGFELKNSTLSNFTLRPGFTYKGSFSNIEKSPQQTTLQSVLTYQRGNTTFIYPYKHVVQVPRFKTPEKGKF